MPRRDNCRTRAVVSQLACASLSLLKAIDSTSFKEKRLLLDTSDFGASEEVFLSIVLCKKARHAIQLGRSSEIRRSPLGMP